MRTYRTIVIAVLFIFSLGLLNGCIPKDKPQNTSTKKVKLVFYSLFDDEDIFQPLIQQYTAKNPNITISYRKFTDPVEYENLIINELAEGQGPDIFSVPNSWFLRNTKKLSPLPPQILSPAQFEQTFVSVANNDLVLTDPADGQKKVFGLPTYIDTLALYYNKAAFEDKLASTGRPSTTWEGIKEDVYKLSKTDNSFERFEVSGIAMGRSDNISRASDILTMLMLQYKTKFYNDNYSQTAFINQQTTLNGGVLINPAAEALRLYTSFALPTNKNYSWNSYLSTAESPVKELETFAKGKVAMIFGYSYIYDQLKAEIKDLKSKGVQTIEPQNIKIANVPQVNDPASSTEKRVTFANYYAQTVARTTEHPAEAWDFLMFITSKNSLQYYNSKTKRPSSRRDMITDQMKDPIYSVFAEQTGYAESLPQYNKTRYDQVFSQTIDSVLATTSPEDALRNAAAAFDSILPPSGLIPTVQKSNTTSQQTK